MVIKFKKVYKFNLDTLTVLEINLSEEANDFTLYLDELIENVVGDDRSKRYLFPTEITSIKEVITKVVAGEIDAATMSAAKRLLREEQTVQRRIEHMDTEVQKGIMLQAMVEYNNQNLFLIIKAEHADFINENDNRKTTGLPIKRKIFKAFCAYLDGSNNPEFAKVSDYRTRISDYWWNGFLELVEEHTDDYNTEKAFDALDRKVFNKIKSIHPQDYMFLRNSTVQYFRSKEIFVMTDYVQDVITSYVPEDPSLNMVLMGNNILLLPEREKFDNRFSIVRSKIKKKIIKNINLTPQLLLVIKENIDWNSTVKAIEKDNIKYIQIRTEEGYKFFKKD